MKHFGNAIQLAHTLIRIDAWQECFTTGLPCKPTSMTDAALTNVRNGLALAGGPGTKPLCAANCESRIDSVTIGDVGTTGQTFSHITTAVRAFANANSSSASTPLLGEKRRDVVKSNPVPSACPCNNCCARAKAATTSSIAKSERGCFVITAINAGSRNGAASR